MPKFTYKVRELSGEITEGQAESADRFALAADLRKEGKTIISVDEIKKGTITMGSLNTLLSRVKTEELVVFCHNVSAMMKAGLALSRTLGILERQTTNPRFKSTLKSLTDEISKGNPLSAGMAKFPKVFSPLFVSMVRAGEESGGLPDAFQTVGDQLEKSYMLKKKIKGAMIYPSVVISALVIIGILMFMFVVPTLSATFKELKVELPTSTKVVMAISDFLANHFFVGVLIFIAGVVGIVMALRTPVGRRAFERALFYLPVVNKLMRESNSARTARTLASLLSSGVDMVEAITITRDVMQNSFYKEVMTIAGERVQKGIQLSVVFKEYDNVYPLLVGEMVEVGEETGKLSEMLTNLATYYENEVDAATKNMTTIIEPLLMVFIGASVGFFAVSMITPMYSVMTNL